MCTLVFWHSTAGSIILGGDDFYDHGGYDNQNGTITFQYAWKYIEKALDLTLKDSKIGGGSNVVALLGTQELDMESAPQRQPGTY